MEEIKGKHGGARPNTGRLKKEELLSLIDSMDAILVPKKVWESLAEKVLENDVNATKIWLSYRYGMPTQTIDTTVQLIEVDFED